MPHEIMLCSRSTQAGDQQLYVESDEPVGTGIEASPIPAEVVRRSEILDSALRNTSGPIPLPILESDFYLWLNRSSESIEDKCSALKVNPAPWPTGHHVGTQGHTNHHMQHAMTSSYIQVAEFLCDTEQPRLENEVATQLSNAWARKFHGAALGLQQSSNAIQKLSPSLRNAILSRVSLHSLLCNGPADLQAEAIAAQASPGSHLTLQLPSTNLLDPRTLFSSLTCLRSLSLELKYITDSRWLYDLFHFLPAFTSLLTLSLSNSIRGTPELSMLLHGLAKLSTLTSLKLVQTEVQQHVSRLELPRAIQTTLLPSLPALRSLSLSRIPIHLLGYTSIELLATDLNHLSSLTALLLTHSALGASDLPPLLRSLSALPALHTISLAHSQYLAATAMPLLTTLTRLTACRSLSLAGVTVANPGSAASLPHPPVPPGAFNCFIPPALTALDLSGQPLSGSRRCSYVDVAHVLLQQLYSPAATRALRALRLRDHRITSGSMASLLACIERGGGGGDGDAAAPLQQLEVGPMTGATIEAGPRFVAALRAQTALTRLSLHSTILEPAQLTAVLRDLGELRSLAVLCARRVLAFDNVAQRLWDAEVAAGAADALSRLTRLTALSTNWPHALPAGDAAFPDALGCLQGLRELRIEQCDVAEGATEALAAGMGRLQTLETLELERCGLFKDHESARALAGALQRMPGLTRVRLLGKAVTDVRDVGVLVGGLKGAWGLRELALAVQDIPIEEIVGLAQELPCRAELLQMRCGDWEPACNRRARR